MSTERSYGYLEGTVHLSGQPDQLRLHRLADGTAVPVQGHAVEQEEAAEEELESDGEANRAQSAAAAELLTRPLQLLEIIRR